ncbi:uncharacterized protein LOC123538444 [Mercenaria mercenaria]|uniref:uncharacterized protein LOC123538444 n=1 Tax=Mercenaria mercenaria TaxID=6596 RepID=UPI00234F79D2|nr:uncharacterized protein LOC123538444 [Mercenaria mercenaria]
MAERLSGDEHDESAQRVKQMVSTGSEVVQMALTVVAGAGILYGITEYHRRLCGIDPYAASLFLKALRDGTEQDNYIRVNVVGNFGQGKTSLVRRLIGEKYNCDIMSTNGIDVVRYICQKTTSGEISYTEQRGIDSYEFVRRVVGAKIDADTHKSPKATQHHVSSMTAEKQRKKNTVKSDLIPKGLSIKDFEVLTKVTRSNLRKQRFVSDSEAVHFDLWDFGGQHIFYATHTLFHSSRAVYLLVFNLSLPLRECVQDAPEEGCLNTDEHTMEYFLRFWVNSIHSFVGHEDGLKPPIILVGTHKDKLGQDETEIKKKSEKTFDKVRKLFKGKQCLCHIIPEEFAVDNTDPKADTFSELLTTILRLGHESTSESIPTKWIQLEKALKASQKKGIVTLREVKKANQGITYPLENLEQIKLFLKYHHDRGTLFYFDETPISEYVVLDPQYLIDAFKCIITAPRLRRNAPDLQTYWQRLEEEAKLEMELINSLWSTEKTKDFMQHKFVLLSFLNKNLIISEALEYNEDTETSAGLGWYIVPSMLRDHISATEISSFLSEKSQTKIRFILTFDNSSIVPVIYHRLIAACVGKWSVASYKNKKLLYENLAVVRLDKIYAGLLEMDDIMIELSVIAPTYGHQIKREIADCFRRFVESVVVHEFRKHQTAAVQKPKPYTVWYRCTHPSHKLRKSDVGKPMSYLDDEDEVLCPDSESHLINVKCAKSEWFQGDRVLDIPDVELSMQHLSTLSTCIGRNWECIAPDLQLTQVNIDHIKEDNKGNTHMQIYVMLQNWKMQQLEAATMKKLILILRNRPVVNVDWDKIRTVVEEINNNK